MPAATDLTRLRIYATPSLQGDDEYRGELHATNNKAWSELTATVPEPGGAVAAGAVVMALAALRRRRKLGGAG